MISSHIEILDDHLSLHGRDVYLEQEVQELTPDSWIVMIGPDGYRTYAVTEVSSGSRADFAISAKTTGLDLASVAAPSGKASPSRWVDGVGLYDPPDNPDSLELRKTLAYVQSKAQTLAPMPYLEPVQRRVKEGYNKKFKLAGATYLTLDRMVLGLTKGQPVMVSGIEAGDAARPSTGVARSEVAILAKITHTAGRTTLYFTQALAYRYVRSTCAVNANVIFATHGETVASEVLGSGDGGAANQSFVLRKKPMTYVPAANPRGAKSTIDVRVNGVLWDEVPSLFEQSPRSQSYVMRHSEDGSTTLQFGDGVHGARLPSGQENLIATYRTGIGLEGNVRAKTLSLLTNPPLGVRAAVNPIAASGGAAPEQLANARHNAPLTVLTLDRIVSLQDFEDFARGFAGVGKVHAQAIWSGDHRVVYLSVADASGKQLDPSLALYTSLLEALTTLSDGSDEITIGEIDPESGTRRTFIERRFQIEATVGIDPKYVKAIVEAAVTSTLAATFAFEARELAQHVTEADVLVAIQQVPGVVYARLTKLADPTATDALPNGGVLVAGNAQWRTSPSGKPWIQPAELLVVSPTGIAITGVAP